MLKESEDKATHNLELKNMNKVLTARTSHVIMSKHLNKTVKLSATWCSCDVTVTRWSCINIGYVFCWWRPAKPRWRYCSSFVWSRSPNVHLFQKYRLTFLSRSCVPSKSTLVQAILTTTKGWRHQMETFLRHWPFVRGIYWPPVNSPHKGQWRRAFIFSVGWAGTHG